jgi:hypothetical protein
MAESEAVTEGTTEETSDGIVQDGGREEGGKPDYVDEKFWNPELRSVDIEGLSKSYSELGTKIREKSDLMRQSITDEMAADKIANRPETSEDYNVRIPDDLAKDMSDDMNFEFNENDPMLTFWKEFSHDNGFSQEIFDSGLSAYVSAQFSNMPSFEEELGKLGDHGRDRSQHVNLWAQKNFSGETYEAFKELAVTAQGVVALEEIMKNQGEPNFSPGGLAGVGTSITLNELRTMQADPRYWDPNKRETEFIRKVDKGYEDLVSAG